MKVVGILVNFFIPGIGSMIVGKVGQGIFQFLLWLFGVFLNFTMVGAIIGIPICIVAWIWSLITAATINPRPIQVQIVHTGEPPRLS